MFNSEIKEKYLDTLSEGMVMQMRPIFAKAEITETLYNKDIYDFTSMQILELIRSFDQTTIGSVRRTLALLSLYIDWAISYKLSKGLTNLARTISEEELYECLGDKKLYITYSELEEMENQLVNYQSKAVLRLLFEGVSGLAHSELLSLTKKQVEDAMLNGNVLTLHDSKHGERKLKVSSECLVIALNAAQETKYKLKNGKAKGQTKEVFLVENDYVVKTKRTSNKGDGQASKFVITNLITDISEFFKINFLTPNTIVRSGHLYRAYQLYKEKGVIDNSVRYQIIDDFNLRVKSKYRAVYSMQDYINEEEVNKYYAEELGLKETTI
ncbi:hypothetical protein MOC47_08530 [Bacillus spizizenii]|uniref:Uncharacterized protein n=1 Tax=Bacillus spizizenii TaxID=96241 RepID=A0A9Q4DT61_BACSC|nr:hypothetical protein [Bacillus halotolerans]MCY8123233.1 hypothetical protein [Bacillus spizizenii]WIT26929.1 hypothetical protein [Bacillus phage SPbetaL1]MCY8328892.1 hypothetical protein [Bacillus spizizenii]MEC0631427.1 hypothetical protein [Bacillus spizizenii]MEC1665748.1 hypothetical protein [Bacillus halotolerans]